MGGSAVSGVQRYSFLPISQPFFSKSDGLTPVLLMSSCLGHTLCRFAPAFSRFAYATSTIDLYASTLAALTILPRKARRDPTCVYEIDESQNAYAYDTPPYAFALK